MRHYRAAALLRLDPSDETTRRHHDKAVFEVRRAKRPDYYGILNISKVASVTEIKQAYKAGRCTLRAPSLTLLAFNA